MQRGPRFSDTEVALIAKDGKRVDMLLAATPRRCDVASEIVGTIVVGQDITQARQARTAGEIFLFSFTCLFILSFVLSDSLSMRTAENKKKCFVLSDSLKKNCFVLCDSLKKKFRFI